MSTQRNFTKFFNKLVYILAGLISCLVIFNYRTIKDSNKSVSLFSSNYIPNEALRLKILKWKDLSKKNSKPTCIISALVGPLKVVLDKIELKVLKETELDYVHKGGWWGPADCKSISNTAIIVPFRKREDHLPILLRQLHLILKRQNLNYRIFVIEQDDPYTFNRGKLMNVGYREASKYFTYDCFVFHDVDLIPEDDKIDYGCRASPSHHSGTIDKFNYKLPYRNVFGGVSMLNSANFLEVNGFSNVFWYWGGEDDNMASRLKKHGLEIHRQSLNTLRYTMIKHEQSSEKKDQNTLNAFLLKSVSWSERDCLNSLKYDVKVKKLKDFYTKIVVNLRKDLDQKLE